MLQAVELFNVIHGASEYQAFSAFVTLNDKQNTVKTRS